MARFYKEYFLDNSLQIHFIMNFRKDHYQMCSKEKIIFFIKILQNILSKKKLVCFYIVSNPNSCLMFLVKC